VPFGRNNLTSLFNEDTLQHASRVLQGVDILAGSYEQAIKTARAGDFIYLDPPYIPLSDTASFTKYTGTGFGVDKQLELRGYFRELDKRGCYVMLSNSNMDKVREFYTGYTLHEVLANRAVNCKAKGRGKITELLITNY